MSKAEILAELPKLSQEELAEIQSRIEDLADYGPDGWRVDADLTDAEKRMLESRLEELEKNPENDCRQYACTCQPVFRQALPRVPGIALSPHHL